MVAGLTGRCRYPLTVFSPRLAHPGQLCADLHSRADRRFFMRKAVRSIRDVFVHRNVSGPTWLEAAAGDKQLIERFPHMDTQRAHRARRNSCIATTCSFQKPWKLEMPDQSGGPVTAGLLVKEKAILKTLIATLTNNLSRPKYNHGYQTRVDPELGDMSTTHDTMEFEPIARAAEIQHIDDTWLSHPQTHGTSSAPGNWCTGVFEHAPSFELFSDPFMDINPANGLPMMDECLDVAGNLFGTSGFDTDLHSSFI